MILIGFNSANYTIIQSTRGMKYGIFIGYVFPILGQVHRKMIRHRSKGL